MSPSNKNDGIALEDDEESTLLYQSSSNRPRQNRQNKDHRHKNAREAQDDEPRSRSKKEKRRAAVANDRVSAAPRVEEGEAAIRRFNQRSTSEPLSPISPPHRQSYSHGRNKHTGRYGITTHADDNIPIVITGKNGASGRSAGRRFRKQSDSKPSKARLYKTTHSLKFREATIGDASSFLARPMQSGSKLSKARKYSLAHAAEPTDVAMVSSRNGGERQYEAPSPQHTISSTQLRIAGPAPEEPPDEGMHSLSIFDEANTSPPQQNRIEFRSLAQDDSPGVETEDEVFEGVLSPDIEQTRRQMLDNAVSATDVRPDIPSETKKKRDWICISLVLVIVVSFSVGVLGVTLGSKDNATKSPSPTSLPSAFPSSAPSEAPTTASFSQVADSIESLFGTPLQDKSSPQYRAAEWIADVDIALDLPNVEPERFKQRYALVVFYYATGGGDSWKNQASFLSADKHECEWNELAPEEASFTPSGFIGVYQCTEQMQVVAIELVENNLTGTIPPEIGVLSNLDFLFLNINNIGGSLPLSLFSLSSLRLLWLPFNNITGTLPTEVGNLSNLSFIWMERTTLEGSIPSEIGNLSNLIGLSLAEGSLTGTIPETLLRLSGLLQINFHQNALSGQMPSTFPSSWPDLIQLAFSSNRLSGPLPTDIGSLSGLESFFVSENNLTGPIPASLMGMEMLTKLYLSNNLFTGSLPSDWNRLSRNLHFCFLRDNRLTGTIPASLGNLTKLNILDFRSNSLSGSIPAELGDLPFTGDVPDELANFNFITGLYLEENALTGTVPTSFQQLKTLGHLTLDGNKLVGDLSFLCNGTNLLHDFEFLAADCIDEVVCPCCSRCCDAENQCILQ